MTSDDQTTPSTGPKAYQGVVVASTPNFRNPHYHQPTDTLETLDLEFAAQVVG